MTGSSILNEGRLAIRRAIRHPWIALFKAIVLGIGIAAASSIFSVYFAFMHQALPFEDTDRLMYIGQTSQGRPTVSSMTTFRSYEAIQERNTTLAAFGTAFHQEKEVRSDDIQEFAEGMETSANYLEVLGSKPLMGSIYREATWEDENERPVALSHGLWVSVFDSDPDIIGKTLYLNKLHCRVVAVMQPNFMIPRYAWMEAFFLHPIARSEIPESNMKSRWFASVGRLKDGESLKTLLKDLEPISDHVTEVWPTMMNRKKLDALPLREFVTRGYTSTLMLLMIFAYFVLGVATANLIIISFAESNKNSSSEAIRQYFGARWIHRLAATICENLPNMIVGSIIGLMLGDLLLRWIGNYLQGLPIDITHGFETRCLVALLFSVGVAVLNACIYAIYSRLRAGFLGNQAFRQGHRVVSSKFSKSLLKAQLTASSIAIIVVGLFMLSQDRRFNIDHVVKLEQIYTVRIAMDSVTMPETQDRAAFFSQLENVVEAIPGVALASSAHRIAPNRIAQYPMIQQDLGDTFEESNRIAGRTNVSETIFDTLGLRMIEGRAFTENDMRMDAERTLIINQAMRDQFWPDENPIGKRVKFQHRSDINHWARIIGVVENQLSIDGSPEIIPYAYRPNSTFMYQDASLLIRMETPDTPLDKTAVEQAIRTIGPSAVFYDIETLEQVFENRSRWITNLIRILAVFAIIVICLTATGVLAFYFQNITQRGPEFELRMILGATPSTIRSKIVRETAIIGSLSFVTSVPLAALLGHVLREYLYQTTPLDPLVYSLAYAVLATVVSLSLAGPLFVLIKEKQTLL